MTEKRFKADKYYFEIWDNDEFLLSFDQVVDLLNQLNNENEQLKAKNDGLEKDLQETMNIFKELEEESEQLKKGMIRVVDRYIKNVDCNPPSSARTYMKIKGALLNIREDLRDLIEDLE